jgi:hypothetical protein
MEVQQTTGAPAFLATIRNPVKFRLYLLQKLPAAYFSGLRIKAATPESCAVTIPFAWFTRNPFRSTYFACLSMAAEMSTGILAMAHLYGLQPKVSMLVVSIDGQFVKKATGITTFVCEEGRAIREAIEAAISTGEPRTITVLSSGTNAQGETVAYFRITWSFKSK